MELEKIEQDKLKRRGPHRNKDAEMDDDMSTDHGSIKVQEIQKLIKRRKAKKDGEMKAKISNGFIDQLLISMLINKVYVKETLQKEYQKQLDAEVNDINKVNLFN